MQFHIQQNLTPIRLRLILAAAAEGNRDLESTARECQISLSVLQKVVLPFVRRLCLVDERDFRLTKLGSHIKTLSDTSPFLLAEAVHQLLYTGHLIDTQKGFSWAYARLVDTLWAGGQRILGPAALSQLAGSIIEDAAAVFDLPTGRISFSDKSVYGALHWLGGLEPPVVSIQSNVLAEKGTRKTRVFRRRYYCSPIVFLWALDFLYREVGTPHGVRMFLSPSRIDALCRTCLLDPSGLENVLMMTKRITDYDRGGVFDYGTEGGFGRWLMLARNLSVPALPEEVDF